MKNDILLFDFDGVYQKQDFYKKNEHEWVFKNRLTGSNAYCDQIASHNIRKKLKNIYLPNISFIGSGNYHYISLFLTEKLTQNFTLVLFDNHSDMQKTVFEDLLSCGSWLRCAFENEKYLKQIVLVGTSRISLKTLDARFKEKVTVFPNDIIFKQNSWYTELRDVIKYPVYISVDKDVFCEDVAKTNWDQGQMHMYEFVKAVEYIIIKHKIIGMDVCGEYLTNYTNPIDFNEANSINNSTNEKILTLNHEIIEVE
ncbi:arginase family protein [Sedimentibacter sp. zth1]|uniref:arginase family protein n=1 Tax=Sedimentibacter sp. zth1 TaxID=2816908 RepID=UPI001A910587|nr:arginase family protein [Sedimentibacter sp. zth1]QSX06342.1 arginase family protein [Sedimentibacter sp. zth1]